jgi:Uncharacterized conserved protein
MNSSPAIKQKIKSRLEDYLVITFGLVLMSVGIYFFKIPNGFSTGGVSGISTVLAPYISFMTPSTLILSINALLLIIGFAFLGRGFGTRTAVCSLGYSFLIWIFERLFPLSSPLTDQPLLELVYAILLTAIGSALLFSKQASSGGTDIVALILKKYTSVDTGKALFCSDFLIASSAFLAFGVKTGLFSLLGLFMKAFLVDNVLESINLGKYFTIVTEHPEIINRYIIDVMHRSVTQLESIGGYSNRKKAVLLVVCKRIEGAKLLREIRTLDPDAFCMITNTSEIVGRGFRQV